MARRLGSCSGPAPSSPPCCPSHGEPALGALPMILPVYWQAFVGSTMPLTNLETTTFTGL